MFPGHQRHLMDCIITFITQNPLTSLPDGRHFQLSSKKREYNIYYICLSYLQNLVNIRYLIITSYVLCSVLVFVNIESRSSEYDK